MTNRSCGGCTACCKTHAVREVKKDVGQWCRHCDRGIGCRVYTERPPGCVDFKCQYLQGVGEPNERPDKVGFVLDCQEFGNLGAVTIIYEYKAGAFKSSPIVRSWIASHAEHRSPLLMIPLDGTPVLHALSESVRDTRFRLENGRVITLMPYPP